MGKNKMKFIVSGIVIVCVAVAGYLFLGKDNSSKTNSLASNETNKSSSKTNNSDKSGSESKTESPSIVPGIEINKADITSKAKFYPYESKGIKMEVLAVKASDGTIRTAFNTCQQCYSSGKGYYVQEGEELVCQNCGNRFTLSMVGKSKGGCNPVPISDSNKTDDGTKITIDKNYLDKNKSYFSNWKA